MVFKGSERFPDAKTIAGVIDAVGGYFNAYTSDEITSFYVKLAANKVGTALDVLSDMLTTPKYEAKEIEKERGVITEEINMYEDDPASQLPVLLDATQYPGHPLGRPILGPKENIARFPRQEFLDYAATYLTPDRAILAITGDVSGATDAVLEPFLARFGGKSTAKFQKAPKPPAKRLSVKHRKTEQTHLGLALRGPALTDRPASLRLDILAMILGGNMSSRLFTEVREKRGLAYSVHANPDQLTDVGSLDVYAGVTNAKATQATKAIITELKRLRDGDLTDEEVAVGKESLRGTRALRWEDSTSLGTLYAMQQLLLGEMKTPAELLAEVSEVTRDELIALARELCTDDRLHLAVLGPQEQAPFEKLATLQ
jgi:predicted Zn-dependent peptidase